MKFSGRFDRLFALQGCLPAAFSLIVLVAAVGVGGCANELIKGDFDRQMELSDLDDPSPTIRIMAAKWAGDNKVVEATGPLVDMLNDEDQAVRFYAIEALRRIAGKDYGYKYQDRADLRAEAVGRWRKATKTTE